jgi:hypothetical protein
MDPSIIIVVIVFLGALAALPLASSIRHHSEWSTFAYVRNLELRGSWRSPAIEGRHRGHRIRVIAERPLTSKHIYTTYRVTIEAPMPPGFMVREEGLLQLLGQVVGVQDIKVGDRELDDALVIQGDDIHGVIRLMNLSEVGAAVLGMVIVHPTIEVGQDIVVRERGIAGGERLEVVLDGLCELARALEEGYEQLRAEDGGKAPWGASG